jgi:hypothetical protein
VTRTPRLPAKEPRRSRQLIARTDPDAGGSHELFTSVGDVQDLVCARVADSSVRVRPGGSPEPAAGRADVGACAPWPGAYGFEEVRRTALRYASQGEPYAPLLSPFADCCQLERLDFQQDTSASYRQLADVAHSWGTTGRRRVAWYRVAQDLSLTYPDVSRLLRRLGRLAT